MTRIVSATLAHVDHVAEHMRKRDVDEVRAASGRSPRDALVDSLLGSSRAWTMLTERGEPYAIFGVAPWFAMPDTGAPWLLATDTFRRYPRFILANTKRYVAEMHRDYPILMNYVDARNTDSLRWLMWSGFQFTGVVPEYGVERRPFLRFSKVEIHV